MPSAQVGNGAGVGTAFSYRGGAAAMGIEDSYPCQRPLLLCPLGRPEAQLSQLAPAWLLGPVSDRRRPALVPPANDRAQQLEHTMPSRSAPAPEHDAPLPAGGRLRGNSYDPRHIVPGPAVLVGQ